MELSHQGLGNSLAHSAGVRVGIGDRHQRAVKKGGIGVGGIGVGIGVVGIGVVFGKHPFRHERFCESDGARQSCW